MPISAFAAPPARGRASAGAGSRGPRILRSNS
jgi:hypothetical protein